MGGVSCAAKRLLCGYRLQSFAMQIVKLAEFADRRGIDDDPGYEGIKAIDKAEEAACEAVEILAKQLGAVLPE